MTDETDQQKEKARLLALDVRWLGYDGVRAVLDKGGQRAKVCAAYMDRVARAAARLRRAQNDLADLKADLTRPQWDRKFEPLTTASSIEQRREELRRREAVHAAFKRANVVYDATAGRYDLDVTIDGDTVRMYEQPADLAEGDAGG